MATAGRCRYTVDFLVVRADGVYVYQCKARRWLQELSQEPNPRYVYDTTEAVWRHPAAEKAFRPYGFTHRVFHCGDVNPNWLRNVRFLGDFLSIDPPAGVDAALEALRRFKSLSLFDAFRVEGTTREAWYWLIASGRAVFDLERDVLDRADLAQLASVHESHGALECHRLALDSRDDAGVVPSLRDSAVLCLDPGVAVLFRNVRYDVVSRDAVEVVLCPAAASSKTASLNPVVISVDSVSALVDSGDLRAVAPTPEELVAQHARRRIASATNEERLRARERWSIVCEYRSTGAVPSRIHRGTLSNYLAWAQEASRVEGSEFLGMLRRTDDASAVPRISGAQHELLRAVASAFHLGKYSSRVARGGAVLPIPSRRRVSSAYSDYLRLSKEAHLAPCAPKTLRREIKRYSHEKSERARRGRRAAYAFSPPVGVLEDPIPVHGAFAFDVGAVDHQLLDIWCVSGATGARLGRPWFTPIIDGYSRMPLGFTLRFDPPCVFSVMCAIWDCIARHKRFVNVLGSDQGAEFHSPDIDVALAYCRTAHLRRPPTTPRFGALIERFFGSLKTRVIDELSGSIDTIARSRDLTSTHDPQRHALWTLPALSRLIETYLFGTYPSIVPRGIGAAPRDVFAFSNEHAGERVARNIPLDETLALALSETVPGPEGTRTVPEKGGPISVCRLPFHHPEFSDDRVRGCEIPVRRCAADASFVYVRFPHRGTWERAGLVSGSVNLLHGSSWRQARALVEEHARQHLIATLPAVDRDNAKLMSDLLLSVDEYERKALERRRDVDGEQARETELRLGTAPDSGESPAEPPAPAEASGAGRWRRPFNVRSSRSEVLR